MQKLLKLILAVTIAVAIVYAQKGGLDGQAERGGYRCSKGECGNAPVQ